ncbi:hypothetical protein R50073_45970 [Maricurvus nonylphenolicus]|uniref:DUF2780 domain-containing protein n=1 Tax=Maricurvus nonylphenolicus TaxID=1008307 RepID=UPI0036F2ADF6
MKRTVIALAFTALASQAQAGLLDTVSGWLGTADEAVSTADKAVDTAAGAVDAANSASSQAEQATTGGLTQTAIELIPAVMQTLGVNNQQAEGGLGAIFGAAKTTLGDQQFTTLSDLVPNMGDLLAAAPDVAAAATGGDDGLVGSLLNSASQYSETVKTANTLLQQFQSLGLDAGMITQFLQVINQYLEARGGQPAVDLMAEGMTSV